MLDEKQILDAARRLDAAEKSRQPLRQFTLDHPDMTMDDAYAIQKAGWK